MLVCGQATVTFLFALPAAEIGTSFFSARVILNALEKPAPTDALCCKMLAFHPLSHCSLWGSP